MAVGEPDIPADIIQRLALLGETPANFSKIRESQGVDGFHEFLRVYLRRREEEDALYQKWAPGLLDFACHCRSVNHGPPAESLTERERAKLPIYGNKIKSAERLRPRNNKAIISCCLPLIGVPVAQRLWPGKASLTVILTPEEWASWWKTYEHPEGALQWWISYWWNIEDPPDSKSIPNRNRDLRVPQGESPWLVSAGLSWGPLAGGSTEDLWAWNGREARFLRHVGRSIF